LPDYVARALEKVRPLAFATNERVFKRGMPDMDTFRRDLAAARIPYIDKQGCFADFHALRMTYSTLVALVENSERIRMALNRHSDPRLTAHTYTDTSMLPLRAAINRLPVLIGDSSDSHIRSQELVPSRPKVSPAVPIEPGTVSLLAAGNELVSPDESASVPQSPKPIESAPCRNRTCNPVIKSHLLCQLS
jgi:hypothetical protein